ncbi:YIP1 family protein [Gayadomonas joobiniege]|uniref:YIP1 family protein n=1 Tax=Gayadomonas joobiniege TaxID=1234606 RepID=UPI00036FD6AD|nr:YIP1 family protein [Gayadomonas joobiniege]
MNQYIILLGDLISRPKYAFNQIEQQTLSAWFPFFIVNLSLLIFWSLYFSMIDTQWLINMTLSESLPQASEQERQALAREMTPEVIKYSSVFGSQLMLMLQGLLAAAYLNIATKLDTENTDSFKNWYGFYWWLQIPVIFQLGLAIIVLLFSEDGQASLYQLQITSLNQLLNLAPGQPLYSFAASFDFFSLWTFVLLFYGLSIKTQLKTATIGYICFIPVLMMIAFSLLF